MEISALRKANRRTQVTGPKTGILTSRDWKQSPYLAIMVLVFFFGGSARHDTASLLLLRPLSILLCGAAFYLTLRNGVLRGSAPLWFLSALIALVVLQLIPWPQEVWQAFPNRDHIVEVQKLMGLGDDVWRPLSLAPSRTYNTLFSLAVPLTVLLGISLLEPDSRHRGDLQRVLLVLLALGFLAVLWGALQLLGSGDSPFYTYRITNSDVPVGPFANRNHQAMFLGSLIPLIGWQFLFKFRRTAPAMRDVIFAALSIAVIMVAVLLTGSRAGFALSLAGVGGPVLMLAVGNQKNANSNRGGNISKAFVTKRLGAPLIAVALTAAIGTAWLYTGAEFFGRMQGSSPLDDMRARATPHIWSLLIGYFPVGSGFGSFEFVYKAIEPTDLLNRRYLNQAHNDFLQFVLEGGILGLLFLVGFAFWFAWNAARFLHQGWRYRFRHDSPPEVSLGIAATLAALVILLGSVVDYPLRTPLGMAYFATLCGLIATASRELRAAAARP